MKKSIFILGLFLLLFSCSNNKEELIQEYHKIYSIVKEKNFDKTYQILDSSSQKYIKFLVDTSNWQFEKIRKFGQEKNIEFTTLDFYYLLKSVYKGEPLDKSIVLEIFGVSEIPLFNWFKEPKLLEKKTKGDYVLIAYDLDAKTYYSIKVKLKKDQNGNYKLNIFPLFKMYEKALKYKFNRFKRTEIRKGNKTNYELLVERFFKELDK